MGNYETVTVHAGHTRGGGARGSGYEESAVARQFVPVLLSAFAKVGQRTVNCTDDVSTTQNANLSRLVQLCNAVNKNGRLDISLHFNASVNASATGVEVLYYDRVNLAAKVSSAIANASGLRDRGPKEDKSLRVLNSTNAPAILIELAFITNASDMQKFFNNMQAIANAIVQAVTGQAVSSTPPPVQNNVATIIRTGGLSLDSAKAALDYLSWRDYRGKIIVNNKAEFIMETGGLGESDLATCKEDMKRKGWYCEEVKVNY